MTAPCHNVRTLLIKAMVTGLVVCLPLSVLALPEKELAASFESQVRPFFAEQFSQGSFQGVGGVTLHYAKREALVQQQRGMERVPQPDGVLVLVKGRTEFLSKYAELLYDLRDLPLSIYLLDHRGQGRSERLLPEHDKGHVGDFQEYVDDLAIFIDTVVTPDTHPRPTAEGTEQKQSPPLFLLGHSMGGTVAALYANSHPGMVRGMILCAPMLAINTRPFPVAVTRLLAQSANGLGFGAAYVPGGGPYDPAKPFSRNDVTHSQARFELNQRLVAAAPADALGSPTYGWVNQAFSGMGRVAGEHRNLTMPVLLLQAGADTVVDNSPQSAFCANLPACTLVEIAGAKHEILMEEDRLRNQALMRIRDFLERHLPVSPTTESQP